MAAAVAAQTTPLPVLPPQPTDLTGTEGGGIATALRPAQSLPRWEYGLGFGLGWDSNIDFRVPDGPSSWALSPRGSFARLFRKANSELRLAGRGNWTGYPEETELNRSEAGVSLDASHRATRNTTLRAAGSYDLGYSDTSSVLLEQGVLLPRVRTRTLSGSAGLTRTFGARSSFRLDGRLYQARFDQDDPLSVLLEDGLSYRGTAALEQSLGNRDTLAFQYSVENARGRQSSTVDGQAPPDFLTHYGSLQLTRLFSPRSALMLEGGASHTPSPAEAGLAQATNFYGGLSYSREVKGSSVRMFVRREVAPAFGLGVNRLETRLGLRTTRPIGQLWSVRLDGTLVLPESPEGVPLTYSNPSEASLGVERLLGRFMVSTEARYRHRDGSGTIPAIDGFQAGIYLSLVSRRLTPASPIARPSR